MIERAGPAQSIPLRLLRRQPLLYSAVLLGLGLAYRATFLSQGYNATDEGWLQTLGSRIVHGQVAYRDFYYVLPPVAAYKEAALIRLFGDGYGILASRWVFAVEASLASVLAFLIVRRFVGPRLAFFVTLPTVFFSVIFYYFSNYTYDAVFLSLLSATLLVSPIGPRRVRGLLSGGFAALAFLAKPTFLGFVIIVPILLALDTITTRRNAEREGFTGLRQDWPYVAAGFASVCLGVAGYFSFEHALGQFLYQSFVLTRLASPTSVAFLVWQDLPSRLLFSPTLVGLLVLVVLVLALVRFPGAFDGLRLVAIGLVLAVVAYRARHPATTGLPTARQEFFVIAVFGLLLALTLVATAVTVTIHGSWLWEHPAAVALRAELFPPHLAALALVLQYLGQYNYAGIKFAYVSSYLSVPVALLFLRGIARTRFTTLPLLDWRPPLATLTATLVGIWIAVGSILVTRGTVYRDGTRAELTASFQTPRLTGITSTASNAALVDGLVRTVDRNTRPGDPILVFPDFPVLYFLTGRTNPTKVDWYDTGEITPSMVSQAITDLQQRPARLIFIQMFDGGDFRQSGPRLDYAAQPKLSPLYAYVTGHYRQLTTISGVAVFVPM